MSKLDLYGNPEQNPTPTITRLQLKKDAEQKIDGKYLNALCEVEFSKKGIIDTLILIADSLLDEKAERFLLSYRIEEKSM